MIHPTKFIRRFEQRSHIYQAPYVQLAHSVRASETAHEFAATTRPSVLVIEGSCGNGKTRLVDRTLSQMTELAPERSILRCLWLSSALLGVDHGFIRGSILVVENLSDYNWRRLGAGELLRVVEALLGLNISLIIETDLDLTAGLEAIRPQVHHAKFLEPTRVDKVQFARSLFPYRLNREWTEAAAAYCERLSERGNLRAVEGGLFQLRKIEELTGEIDYRWDL